MEKKKSVLLIERRLPNSKLLKKISSLRIGDVLPFDATIKIGQKSYGPFSERWRALSHLGDDYRFRLGGITEWEVTDHCLVSKVEVGSGPFSSGFSEIYYFLKYLPSGVVRPITNLKSVIQRYYPYGPDF